MICNQETSSRYVAPKESVQYFRVSDSEKLNDLMQLLEKNRETLGPIYQQALEIITK